jgi:TrmH family RNA methyltransferase
VISLSEDERRRVSVVLVRARDPINIGAVARSMHDFGFPDLRLVNEYKLPLERARSAVDADAILRHAREFATVGDAVADFTLVVGTTAVGPRRQEHPLHTLAQASGKLLREIASDGGRLALLFGSEKTGLSNQELSHCHWLLTIPMHPTEGMRHASMNLGQAVAVCLYELVRSRATASAADSLPEQDPPGAPGADLERLTGLLLAVLQASGYNRRHPANFDDQSIRRLVLSMGLDRSRALAWTGILRQVLWKLRREDSEESR